jgi:hypothetical protein
VSLCYPTEHGSLFFDDIMVIGPDRQDWRKHVHTRGRGQSLWKFKAPHGRDFWGSDSGLMGVWHILQPPPPRKRNSV